MATRKKIPLIPTDAALTITAAKTVSHAFDFIHSGADLSLVGSGTEQFEFPTSADTLVGRASADTITGVKTFGTIGGAVGKLALAGATSGFSLLNAAAVAGATTLTLPATTGTLALTSDIPTLPVKAIGSELDTGSDDAKFATSKAIKDSHNIPSVVPSTDGNVLTSNGTDWVSEAAGGGGASQLSELSDVVSATNTDKFALMANGTTGYVGRALVEADISDLGTYAATNQQFYIGTTQIAINRTSAALTLAGITLTTPNLGTPSAGTLTNCTFPTLNQNTTGTAANLSGTPNLAIGTLGCGAITSSGFLTVNVNVADSDYPFVEFKNSNAAGGVRVKLDATGAGSDTLFQFTTDTGNMALGIDNSDSGSFKISADYRLHTSTLFILDRSGNATFTGSVNLGTGVIFPTSDPAVAGQWWDDAGTLTKSSG